MQTLLTDAELHTQRQRRRRWVVRLSLVSLLVVVLLAVVVLAALTSGLSIEEAKARVAGLQGNVTRNEAVGALGKADTEEVEQGRTTLSWSFFRHSFDKVDCYFILWLANDGKVGTLGDHNITIVGREAWQMRWNILKWRLGLWKPGEEP
ncbi:MAG: hypothetical protein QM703_13700 [Gemmatales bacterium]